METHAQDDYRAMGSYSYGAVPELVDHFPELSAHPAKPKRQRLSGMGVAQALLLPCGLFTGLFWATSFTLQWSHPNLTTFLLVTGLLVGAFCGAKWWQVSKTSTGASPSWLRFLCASFLLAWLGAAILGPMNYSSNVQRYYELKSLTVFRDVDPRDLPSAKYMDAAAIYFKPGTTVREAKSMGFKSSSLYCVAPIVSSNATDAPPASYDFWAVGTDCCVPVQPAAFSCGGSVGDPATHAALRLMNAGAQDLYRAGIKQAQAEYSYMAGASPLLFTWTTDPERDIEQLGQNGRSFFVTCVIAHAILQTLAVAAMAWKYSSDMEKVPVF